MTDPDQLDAEAAQEQREALQQAALAQSLGHSDNPEEQQEALQMSNESTYLTAHAAYKHKQASKLRQKLEQLSSQIDGIQKQIDAKLDERNNLGDPSLMAGSVATEQARAREAEKMVMKLSYRDDDYGRSEMQKAEAEVQSHNGEAEKHRKDAEEITQKRAYIDKEIRKLSDQKKDLERKREAL